MHYYDNEGNPRHEIVGANGKLRPTTVRDAKKLGLFPSSTTILSLLSKDGLVKWQLDQLLAATILEPYKNDRPIDEYKAMVLDLSQSISRTSSAVGKKVHKSLEDYFSKSEIEPDMQVYVDNVLDVLHTTFPGFTWHSEARFVSQHGFGGCVDLWGVKDNDYVVIDFKTKDKEDLNTIVIYDDYKMQLASYQMGLELPNYTRRFNLLVSVEEKHKGETRLIEHDNFDKYWNMFNALLTYWKIKNEYNPTLK